jgi:hypothetical protein
MQILVWIGILLTMVPGAILVLSQGNSVRQPRVLFLLGAVAIFFYLAFHLSCVFPTPRPADGRPLYDYCPRVFQVIAVWERMGRAERMYLYLLWGAMWTSLALRLFLVLYPFLTALHRSARSTVIPLEGTGRAVQALLHSSHLAAASSHVSPLVPCSLDVQPQRVGSGPGTRPTARTWGEGGPVGPAGGPAHGDGGDGGDAAWPDKLDVVPDHPQGVHPRDTPQRRHRAGVSLGWGESVRKCFKGGAKLCEVSESHYLVACQVPTNPFVRAYRAFLIASPFIKQGLMITTKANRILFKCSLVNWDYFEPPASGLNATVVVNNVTLVVPAPPVRVLNTVAFQARLAKGPASEPGRASWLTAKAASSSVGWAQDCLYATGEPQDFFRLMADGLRAYDAARLLGQTNPTLDSAVEVIYNPYLYYYGYIILTYGDFIYTVVLRYAPQVSYRSANSGERGGSRIDWGTTLVSSAGS